MALVVLSFEVLHLKQFCHIVLGQLSYQRALKTVKISDFLCTHFNIEDGIKYTTFSLYYALLFQER